MASRKKGARAPARNKALKTAGLEGEGAPIAQLAEHAAEQDSLADAMPFNPTKASEYAPADAARPSTGAHAYLPTPTTGAATLSEINVSAKTGAPALEPQSLDGSLAAKRVNSADQALTTNQGVPMAATRIRSKPDFAARLARRFHPSGKDHPFRS